MLKKFILLWRAKGDKGKTCPRCSSTETEDQGPYWLCYSCDYEW